MTIKNGFSTLFYIRLSYLFIFDTSCILPKRTFLKLPKFAQIFNWWRHSGSSKNFWVSRPRFLNSSVNSMIGMVQPDFLGLKFQAKSASFLMSYFAIETPHFASLAPVTSSKSSFRPLVCLRKSEPQKQWKRPKFKCLWNILKKIFFDAVFFVRFVWISSFHLSHKNGG